MPYVCPIAYVDGVPMLDGGVADSIPVTHAWDNGYTNSLVILTRNRGYRKKENTGSTIPNLFYRKYPNAVKAIVERNRKYNATLDMIEKLEKEGEITVLRPLEPLQVSRMEKDVNKLNSLYKEGYELANKIIFL